MPQWTEFPDPDQAEYSFRVVRTPAKGVLRGLITTPKVLGCPTHFVHNRTVPCTGEATCPWHAEGYSWRWHGWVACILYGTYDHVIFEFTAAASDPFKTYYLCHQTMRACRFTASRPSGRSNGRITIGCTRVDEQTVKIPEAPNLRKLLCHLWNIPYVEVSEDTMERPPFQHIGVLPDDGDGRHKP